MPAEHFVQAETPAAEIHTGRSQADAAAVAPARRRFIHRSHICMLAGTLDIMATSLVTVGLCLAAGHDVWRVPAAATAPFILLPIMCVASVCIAGGYRFSYAGSIPEHMFRVGLGAAAAMSLVFLAVLVFELDKAGLFARLCIANALAVFALHGNYLGVVRAATRRGYLSDDVVTVSVTRTSDQPLPR